jgi:hypothetical protein
MKICRPLSVARPQTSREMMCGDKEQAPGA